MPTRTTGRARSGAGAAPRCTRCYARRPAMTRRTSAAEQRPPSNRELQRRVAAIKAIPPPTPAMFSPEAEAAYRAVERAPQASGEPGYVAPAQVSEEHLARLEALLRQQLLAVRCD